MDIDLLRKKFLDHFSSQGYQSQSASGLVPENDPSVLFTTAGMQQFKDYYSSPDLASAEQLSSVQPVVRTTDITEVGDETHLTMFEMLGIFSFGQKNAMAMKRKAIESMWSFIRDELHVAVDRVQATVFAGDELTPEDTESQQVWTELGIEVKKLGREDNFWGPTGIEGPCGPNSEIFIDGIEVGNLVFNQYYQSADKKLSLLENFGLDFGSGLERLSAILQHRQSVWQIEPFYSWVKNIDPTHEFESRVIVDHLRAIIFLVSNGIEPGNKGRDYVLRRLIRKAVFLSRKINHLINWEQIVSEIHSYYAKTYNFFDASEIMAIFVKEKEQFEKNLGKATAYLERWLEIHTETTTQQVTELAFYLYESFGFPRELVIEYLISLGRDVDVAHFQKLFTQHQEISRAGMDKQFKGGLADHNEKTIKHHTAHHLLLAALREILGPSVVQKGSNVTSERLRLDFSFDRKLTETELKKAEEIVNAKIREDLPVIQEQLPKETALQSGALAEFGQKYGEVVSVYSIGNFSKELCGGPHVSHTGELGRFEIMKEEASSQGVRRIKARLT